ncbi:MAG: DUF6688 domain-containing protein [Saprospiraceae bacterium]
MLSIPLILLILVQVILSILDFFRYLLFQKRILNREFLRLYELISVIFVPFFYLLSADMGQDNDCCFGSAFFSPEHRSTVYFWIGLCMIGFVISAFKGKVAAPIKELLLNFLLLAGIVLNIFIAIQVTEFLWFFGNLPIIFIFTLTLAENQRKILEAFRQGEFDGVSGWAKYTWEILSWHPILQSPIVIVLCLPFVFLVTSFLMLFGQKPDSIILAFTQTYHHGFSQLDYLCANVDCGGHYLCSVAAKGHKKIVRPQRLGVRNNQLILCNRQLLVSNAFEELLEERLPGIHRLIRRNYNKVGNVIHRYYYLFEIKLISDIIYILMKPLEWVFLLVLYMFDTKPENRIAIQYISKEDRLGIRAIQKDKKTNKIFDKY